MSGRERAPRVARLISAMLSLAAVLYGAIVWTGLLPNLLEWHYYPKVWMLIGCLGLWAALHSRPSG